VDKIGVEGMGCGVVTERDRGGGVDVDKIGVCEMWSVAWCDENKRARVTTEDETGLGLYGVR